MSTTTPTGAAPHLLPAGSPLSRFGWALADAWTITLRDVNDGPRRGPGRSAGRTRDRREFDERSPWASASPPCRVRNYTIFSPRAAIPCS